MTCLKVTGFRGDSENSASVAELPLTDSESSPALGFLNLC